MYDYQKTDWENHGQKSFLNFEGIEFMINLNTDFHLHGFGINQTGTPGSSVHAWIKI